MVNPLGQLIISPVSIQLLLVFSFFKIQKIFRFSSKSWSYILNLSPIAIAHFFLLRLVQNCSETCILSTISMVRETSLLCLVCTFILCSCHYHVFGHFSNETMKKNYLPIVFTFSPWTDLQKIWLKILCLPTYYNT